MAPGRVPLSTAAPSRAELIAELRRRWRPRDEPEPRARGRQPLERESDGTEPEDELELVDPMVAALGAGDDGRAVAAVAFDEL